MDGLIPFLLLACLVCGLVGAILASHNGWSPAAGILGLFFGPLGLIAILLLGRSVVAQARYELDVEQRKDRLRAAPAAIDRADTLRRDPGPPLKTIANLQAELDAVKANGDGDMEAFVKWRSREREGQ